jgi:hypothetical protein
MRTSVAAIVIAIATAACGDNHSNGAVDAPNEVIDAPPSPDAGPPTTLDQTGLCNDPGCKQINPGILTYTPRWALWADAASKNRWIYLPPGTQIDTTDMDWWKFPQGTKLWKEFTSGSVRVETRLYWKQGPGDADWYQVAYVWNQAQDMAVATPLGMDNANGTTHYVPARVECRQCHERTPGRVLGFSALELDQPAVGADVDLDYLVTHDLLSKPPTKPASGPYFPLWSDASANDIAALGYLHANCGHCHNQYSDVISTCPRLFRALVPQLSGSKTATDTYTSTRNQPPAIGLVGTTAVVVPGDPDHSTLYARFTSTNAAIRMPPLATKVVDAAAATVLHDWIQQMQ